MVPPRVKSYHEINRNPLERVQFFINAKYIFTIGVYKKEMGFFIDFPKFSEYTCNFDNCNFPKGVIQGHSISVGQGEKTNFCPKLSFHESGEVLLSKTKFLIRPIVRNFTGNSIYNHTGDHSFTIMMQNIDLLENDESKNTRRVQYSRLPFDYYPIAMKSVGNIWRKKDLVEDLPQLNSLNYLSETPILWSRPDNKNIADLAVILKLSHIKTSDPLYITIRFMPISVLDKNCSEPLLAIMAGWKFDEMKDGKNRADFIGLIAQKSVKN